MRKIVRVIKHSISEVHSLLDVHAFDLNDFTFMLLSHIILHNFSSEYDYAVINGEFLNLLQLSSHFNTIKRSVTYSTVSDCVPLKAVEPVHDGTKSEIK
jgi:hypothetical protein